MEHWYRWHRRSVLAEPVRALGTSVLVLLAEELSVVGITVIGYKIVRAGVVPGTLVFVPSVIVLSALELSVLEH